MKLLSLVVCVLFGLAVAQRKTIVLDTIIRDFKGIPTSGYHPDFESNCGDDRGVVSTFLDSDGKPALIYSSTYTIHSRAGFAQWFRDTPNVNVKVLGSITLTETGVGTGIYAYNNNQYFPIDGKGWPPGYYTNWGHNFHFTTEVSTEFTYQGKETFSFSGDDDLWVYINNKLAIDLGGCHPPEYADINLDARAAYLNITVGGTYSLKIFNAERHTDGSNFGLTTSLKLVAVPTNICGDGKLQSPEQCDNGLSNGKAGSCCSSNCTFVASSSVCRPAAGDCDVAESCTGSNGTCPSDVLKSLGTPCGEMFGACDVQLEKSCTGSDAHCYGPPAAVSILGSRFSDYTVTSFGSFNVNGGDVEGRLAVAGDAVLDSFTVGLKLTLATDGYRLITALVGGDVDWSSGSLHPDGVTDDVSVSGDAAFLYVRGNFSGAASQYINWVSNVSDVATPFRAAQAYYTALQTQFVNIPINAMASLQYGDGLSITCNNRSDLLYHVQVSGDDLSQTNWYSTNNCGFASRWIIDVIGNSDITIKGAPFPGIVERVIYNVLGQQRTIHTTNGISGHIFAPQNIFNQPAGVTYGLVIAGDIPIAKQNNKPNCQNFKNVTMTTKLAVGVKAGDKIIYVVDYPAYIAGDTICIGGECRKVVSLERSPSKRDQVGGGIVFDAAFTKSASADTLISLTVDASEDRTNVLEYVTPTSAPSVDTSLNWENSASALTGSILIAFLALFMY